MQLAITFLWLNISASVQDPTMNLLCETQAGALSGFMYLAGGRTCHPACPGWAVRKANQIHLI